MLGPDARATSASPRATAGELDRAVDELEDAIALCERMGDRPFLAQTNLTSRSVLLDRGASGDRERALELLDRCLTTPRSSACGP